MIDRITTFTLNIVRSNISMMLFFYASGFLSFISYYRVLGLPYIEGSSQIYAELAGRNIFIILQTFIFLCTNLFTKPDYLLSVFDTSSWDRSWFQAWLVIVLILIVIRLTFKCFSSKPFIINFKQKPIVCRIQILLMTVAVIAVIHIETQPFYAENVLQTSNLAEFYQQKQNIINFEKQTQKIDYERRVKIFTQANSNQLFNKYNTIKSYFFATPEKIFDDSGKSGTRLNALMLIILIASITSVMLFFYRHYTSIKWLLFIFVIAEAVLLPCNCGILGSSYQYPIISLDYTEKDKQIHKDGVFLLAKSQDNLVIYDRLNFFQISYIPQSSIVNMSQVFTSSPFSNCSNGDIKPCEIYAIKQP